MKANEMIRALECMPGDAEVYFEYWLPSSPGENTLKVKKIDVVQCIVNGDKNGVFSEITMMCDEDMEDELVSVSAASETADFEKITRFACDCVNSHLIKEQRQHL